MKTLLKYLGAILVLVGAAIMGVYYFGHNQANGILFAALAVMIVGLIGHIILNKYIE